MPDFGDILVKHVACLGFSNRRPLAQLPRLRGQWADPGMELGGLGARRVITPSHVCHFPVVGAVNNSVGRSGLPDRLRHLPLGESATP